MFKWLIKTLFLLSMTLLISACVTTSGISTKTASDLAQGKRYFVAGYYKRAMHQLLPLACDGNPEAQYAVGYMYYYGYGVTQDTDIGYFWIKRAADQHYPPAIQALTTISPAP